MPFLEKLFPTSFGFWQGGTPLTNKFSPPFWNQFLLRFPKLFGHTNLKNYSKKKSVIRFVFLTGIPHYHFQKFSFYDYFNLIIACEKAISNWPFQNFFSLGLYSWHHFFLAYFKKKRPPLITFFSPLSGTRFIILGWLSIFALGLTFFDKKI